MAIGTTADPIAELIQRARLEVYRDNVEEALRLLEDAQRATPDARIADEIDHIRRTLRHLDDRQAYARAYERYYHTKKGGFSLRLLERELRALLGRRTKKVVERTARDPEFQLLESEVNACRPRRALEAGCGEGRLALALAARHADVHVDAIEISKTNLRLARRMNRFPNAAFHHGFLEDAERLLTPGTYHLAYAFAVLEHVRSVDEALAVIMRMLRPGGRFCFVVPMNEFAAIDALPARQYVNGVAGHVRVFSEAGLRERFGAYPGFRIEKLPGEWPRGYPASLVPKEFGSFFVSITKG